jgi:hypothetical protein
VAVALAWVHGPSASRFEASQCWSSILSSTYNRRQFCVQDVEIARGDSWCLSPCSFRLSKR